MDFKYVEISDAAVIHDLMIRAFMEYMDAVPPSSALEETVQSISASLKEGEQGFIGYVDHRPVGMVRFLLNEKGLYFFRLSVIPEKQGQGIAKKILKSLEDYAINNGIHTLFCKVRMTVPKNIQLYSSIGFNIYEEEVVHKPNGISIKVVSMEKKLSFIE
ncbi:GNAT family N-acetyltransferase [Psychrobacillus soli]|uniref:GNAT family N-acetyltransferase n=1 Tax=Psychrobacillus soli TaxID=1543965 RepID=A0A544TDV2_9BACI|nr:GNAT family N-acetyltransferase [Psychrobacillus soli]TQR15625.1 GNAT family N-acetyltransferase [Psychrobacillus soli]